MSNPVEPSVNAVEAAKKFREKIIAIADNISFDAACSFLLSSKNILTESFKNDKKRISTSFCPKCFAPWIAGNYTSRLIAFPRNSKTIKILKNKEKLKRLPKKKLLLLSAFRNNSNTFKVSCKLCHHSFTNEFKLPTEKKKVCILENVVMPQESINLVHKKKKKRKPKDINAGLFLDQNIRQFSGVESSFDISKINETLLSDSEKSSSSDSDDAVQSGPSDKKSVRKVNNSRPRNNRQLCKRKELSVTSFSTTIKEKKKKKSSTERKFCEKRKKKLKQILAPSLTDTKQRPGGLASFLSSVF